MRILYLLKSNSYSGAENVILTLMDQLPDNYETYYASPDGPIKEVALSRGQKFVALEKPNLRSVKNIINTINPDIIHASDFSMSILATMASVHIPIISHLHNNPTWIKKPFDLRKAIYTLSLRRISKVVCVSSKIIDEFSSQSLRKKAVVIPNAIDLDKVRKMSLAYNTDKSDVCLVGRLTNQKNPLFFCKIIKKIKDSCPDIRAVIIGKGELQTEVESYIQENALTSNVKLIGFKRNPYPFMRNTKLCIMPSKYEGFGLAAVEMLALGKPVIASNVGGLGNIVNEACGTLINGYDVEKYSKSYFRLTRPDIYQKKAKGALITAKKFSDKKVFSQSFENVYSEVVKCQS